MDIVLTDLQWVTGQQKIRGDLRIRKGLLYETGEMLQSQRGVKSIHLKNHYVYPGFINAHDHLEMNLYPRLGHPPYGNYTEWGKDIYHPKKSPIREIEKINIEDRLLMGGLKNLASGATTVAHHNPWNRILSKKKFPVKVLHDLAWSHSLAFGKNIKRDFPKDPETPFVIHAAEGVDSLAFEEINNLNELGLLRKNTVLIHAIAMSQQDIDLLLKHGCSMVWCPASNLFLFNRTANIQQVRKLLPVALGTDSTLTGSPTLLAEMQCAYKTGLATPHEIFDMVTTVPAGIFNLPLPSIFPGTPADLIIAPILNQDYFENLQYINASNIAAVFINGDLVYADELLPVSHTLKYPFTVNGSLKKSTTDVKSLLNRIRKNAGTEILELSPLWRMFDRH